MCGEAESCSFGEENLRLNATLRFITVCAKALHWSQSWISWIQVKP